MNKSKKKAMIIAGSVMASMAAGFALGCMKEKMMNKCNAIIEEV